MKAAIRGIAYHLPEEILDNHKLACEFPDWPAEKIESKTGICFRHISASGECASDLALVACQKLFASGACKAGDIDYLLLCTQSPDYLLPTTACILQDRLGIPTACGALDFNLGCSGFVYGLGLAKGLIETNQASRVLLVTAETYSKFINDGDKSVRTLFGDAAAATLVKGVESQDDLIGPFVVGTDGRGAKNLIVPNGGCRQPWIPGAPEREDESGNRRSDNQLFMNGPEIFNFTVQAVPKVVNSLLERAGLRLEDVDLWVFHQANRYMLDFLRKKLSIPSERFAVNISHCGNTVSSTIPITLKDLHSQGRILNDQTIALVGFGVGYSWGATLVRWDGSPL